MLTNKNSKVISTGPVTVHQAEGFSQTCISQIPHQNDISPRQLGCREYFHSPQSICFPSLDGSFSKRSICLSEIACIVTAAIHTINPGMAKYTGRPVVTRAKYKGVRAMNIIRVGMRFMPIRLVMNHIPGDCLLNMV
jgi:hypothetical protein